MRNLWTKSFFFIASLISCSILSMTTGCASGGFSLTRQYAGWVNSNSLILRIVLYILTFFVFAITMLIDMVFNNTIDFWQGKVSAGTYEFKDADKTYQAVHEYLPGTNLRRSTIQVLGTDHQLLQKVVLTETLTGEVEMYVDGKLRTRVSNITSIPVAAVYDASGKLLENRTLIFTDFNPSPIAKY